MRKFMALFLAAGLSLAAGAQWGGFTPFTAYPAGENVRLVHTVDITGDAVPDLTVLYNAANPSLSVMAGRGDGTFGALHSQAKGDNYFLSDIADLNGDGHPDMVISSYWANGFKIFWGEGGGRLREGAFFSTDMHARALKSVDINRDGRMDVVITTSGSGRTIHLHVFLGRGDGTFDDRQTFPSVLDTCKDIFITDKNGDGRPDVAVTSSFPWVVVFVQKEGGRFEPVYYPMGRPARATFADVNRDRRDDMVLLYSSFDNTPGSDSLVIRLNTGGEDFGPSQKVAGLGERSLRPSHLQVHDLNRDGFQDIFLNHHDAEGEPTDTLFYLAGLEGAQFAAPQYIVAPAKVLYSTLGDLNRDGWLDMVVSCEGGTVNIALNRGGEVPEEPGQWLVYPNPARGWFHVQSGVRGAYTVRIYSALGQLVREVPDQSPLSRIEVPGLAAGLYYVQVVGGESKAVLPVLLH